MHLSEEKPQRNVAEIVSRLVKARADFPPFRLLRLLKREQTDHKKKKSNSGEKTGEYSDTKKENSRKILNQPQLVPSTV